jgi:competence protein ComEC
MGMVVGTGWLVLARRHHVSAASTRLVLCAGVAVACIGLGMFRFSSYDMSLQQTELNARVGDNTTVVGTVVREPDRRAATTFLTVATGDTRVRVSTDVYTPVRYGDTVAVTGKLAVPEPFATDFGRTFDYPGYLRAEGITHTMSFVEVTIQESAPASVLRLLYTMKSFILERLYRVIKEPEAALGAGLLFGVQTGLDDELMDDFRVAGVVHIIVLSGYNILLVVLFVMYILSYLLPFRFRLVAGIGAIVLFALFVGFSPSVVRASIMAILLLVSSLLARPYSIMRALLLAATSMVLLNPYILRYDIGFQLSCMATLGLIMIAPTLEQWFRRVPSGWLQTRSFLVATIATQIAVAPLLLYHIGQWSFVAIPANLLILPLVPVAMLCTFLTVLVAVASTVLALPVAFVATLTLSSIIGLAKLCASIPYAVVTVPAFPGYIVPVLYGGLCYLWYRYVYQPPLRASTVVPRHDPFDLSSVALYTIEDEEDLKPKPSPRSVPVSPKHKSGVAAATPDETPIFFR